jgi:hypothetical protein
LLKRGLLLGGRIAHDAPLSVSTIAHFCDFEFSRKRAHVASREDMLRRPGDRLRARK